MTSALLPNLSALSLNYNENDVQQSWLNACGNRRPRFKNWNRLSGKDKRRLMHAVALEADDDDGVDEVDGSYLSPYAELDIDDVMKQRVWSVEHVLPRSRVMDATSDAKSDPLGWTTATRSANSKRSNHYLMLWQDQVDGQLALPGTTVRIEGQLHFVPPLDQRARLARKWAYIRATYAGDLSPPSRAQIKYAPEIMALAKTYPIHPAEQRVNDIYKRMFDWSNPLLKDGADDWYDNVEWRSLVFS